MLKIYNSLTREKEVFVPIVPGKVRMYVCGMTVYDLCHIGHARVMVVFDVVARYLRAAGYALTYVRNITDVDDKIIQRANERGEHFKTLTDRYIAAMHEDAAALGVLSPDVEPRATDAIAQIIAMVQALLANGHAYIAGNGDVMYDVSTFPGYGRLSGKRIEDLRAGERVAVNAAKDDPLDFVLWKVAKPGEPHWDSPWGLGRPGWHIECSAMSTTELGQHFDIHGGGMDLQFPHHDNEIAQSQGATGECFVNYWMHNGFVRINDQKMSKSLGNFFTVRDVLRRYRPEEIRYFILTSQYRSALNYDTENLDNARGALTRFYTALRGLTVTAVDIDADAAAGGWRERFNAAMDDDFNTPEALAVLFDLTRALNKAKSDDMAAANRLGATLKALGAVLGLLQDEPDRYLKGDATAADDAPALSDAQIEQWIAQRAQARADKNWAEADRIRDLFAEHNIHVQDTAGGSTWRRG